MKKTTNQFIREAQEVHGNKYRYGQTTYTRANQKVKIECPKHGFFDQEANSHLMGHGCMGCSSEAKTKPVKWDRKGYMKAYCHEYRKRNKDKLKEYGRLNIEKKRKARIDFHNRRKDDPEYRIMRNCRGRVVKVIKRGDKSATTQTLLGCSPEELKTHLESLWKEGMNWDNYGLYGWHIDHIRPCSSFNLLDPEEQLRCFHYTNLQPLWAKENLEKRDRYPDDLNNASTE